MYIVFGCCVVVLLAKLFCVLYIYYIAHILYDERLNVKLTGG